MKLALAEAARARDLNEVPIGAVLTTMSGEVISAAHNQPISSCDPTAHAEILALRNGARQLGNYRLLKTALYVTVEPCLMCLGAIIHARVQLLVFGARDPKRGSTVPLARKQLRRRRRPIGPRRTALDRASQH